jgi:hypothetical protein
MCLISPLVAHEAEPGFVELHVLLSVMVLITGWRCSGKCSAYSWEFILGHFVEKEDNPSHFLPGEG